MATLKQLRTRLKGMHSTRKIASAMKWVAAARWRRQQARWKTLKEYIDTFDREMAALMLARSQGAAKAGHILIVCTPNKGLCGGYPSQIKNTARQACLSGVFAKVVVTTEKGRALLADIQPLPPCEVMSVNDIANQLSVWGNEGYAVTVVRGFSRNALAQETETAVLLPYVCNGGPLEVLFEPSEEVLASAVIQHALMLHWQSAWLGSVVAEEAARMSAMDQATRNADEAIALLQRTYNRMRQEKITTELVEMISGSALA